MSLLNEEWNLRWNPFRGLEDSEWLSVVVIDIKPLLSLLERSGLVLQFIGGQGRGKSTHMRALHQYHPQAPFVYLHDRQEDPKPLPKIPHDTLCFIDESQRMNRWLRWRHFRSHRTLILGTHEDHRLELEKKGFDVHTVDVHQKEPDRIKLILKRRVEFARREHCAFPQMTDSYIRHLIERYGDDLRTMENILYEDYMDIAQAIREHKLDWSNT